MGRHSFDPSAPLLQPDGTWHVFPNAGGWGHCTSPDLLHWNCSHPNTGFDGDTGSISVTPRGTFALWPGVGNETGQIFRAVPAGRRPDLDTWTTTGNVVFGWYVPECGDGMAWFRDDSGGDLTNLTLVGDVIPRGAASPSSSVPTCSSSAARPSR